MSDTIKLNNCPKCGAPIPAGAPQGLCPKCVLLGAATATESGVPATATSEIPSLARVAAAFPQLEILELIGRGGMGFVFKARQPHLDRFVALKLLPDKLARDPRFAERFGREGRVLAKLNHPNIVSVYDFGNTEHFYFLTMEYVDGVNLRQAMKAGRFSPGEALAIVPKICDALQYAHGQGILHRDIKPENILLDAHGQVKIADFGIAKLVGEDHKADVTLTATGAALGTPHYMAPEQLEKPLTVDHRADIYSLGVVFYEMLTGELPIGRFAAPSSKTPVGANVDEVVFRTLEKDRERRFQSAGEMKTQVEHLTNTGAATGQASGMPQSLKESSAHVTTPEHARSFVGRFLYIYQGSGTLRLSPEALTFERGWNTVNIPLRSIRALGVGQYSAWAKPVRLDYLAVTFEEHGRTRTLFFTPVPSKLSMAWDANRLTGEWRAAVTAAVSKLTGQVPPEPAAELRGATTPSAFARGLVFMGMTTGGIACAIGFSLFAKGRLPASGAEWLPVALAALPGLLVMAWVLWRIYAQNSDQHRTPPGPHGSALSGAAGFAGPGAMPAWSQKAVWGAALTGLSLPLPVALPVLVYFGTREMGWSIVPFAAIAILLPGLAGTILGWMALSDIRTHDGKLRGLPLAVFGAMVWPVLFLLAATVAVTGLTLANIALPSPAAILLVIPAGLLTFTLWSVYAAAHWGANRPTAQRGGVLKWVFLAMVVCALGMFVTPWKGGMVPKVHNLFDKDANRRGPANAQPDRITFARNDPAAAPWIRFTFTAVELREVQGVRWLAIDYVDDVHGDCQKSFPWETTIPGFQAETRTTEFVTDAKDSSPAVRHQRIEYRMPDSSPRDQLERLRDNLEKALVQKSIRLELGGQQAPVLLFELPGKESGSLKAWVKVVPPLVVPPAISASASAELWSPKLAPGERPNLQDILREARDLAQEGRNEEALQRHIWYHNHALEIDLAQVGVRGSFALVQWVELAGRYPKAKEALLEIRDRGARQLAGGGGTFILFQEVRSITYKLGLEDVTLALFKSIQARNPKLARQCYVVAEDLLVEKGDYALCASFIPDVQSRFDTIRATRELTLKHIDRASEAPRGFSRKGTHELFIKDTRTLIEILVGTGRKAEAENIRDQAVTVLDVPELQSAVADAEKKVAKQSAQVPAFGPVEERTLGDAQAIALASGRTNGLPASLLRLREGPDKDTAICDWMKRTGSDFAHIGGGRFYGCLQDITTLVKDEWNTVEAARLAALLHPTGKVSPLKIEDRNSIQDTYGFKTGGGQYGFLQIMGFTDNPPGVRIRYKLTQGGQDDADAIRIRIAREQLDQARQRQAAGVSGQDELAEAERQLAVAEARGDAVAVAQANLKFADHALVLARKRHEAGVVSSSELRTIENKRTMAESQLKIENGRVLAESVIKEALQRSAAPLSFGPVSERVITSLDAGLITALLDFETGGSYVPPENLRRELLAAAGQSLADQGSSRCSEELRAWLKDKGVDVVGLHLDNTLALVFVEATPAIIQPAESLDTISPTHFQTRGNGARTDAARGPFPTLQLFPVRLWQEPWKSAKAIPFRTREGNQGVLEIMGVTEKPDGVRIHYKLRQPVFPKVP